MFKKFSKRSLSASGNIRYLYPPKAKPGRASATYPWKLVSASGFILARPYTNLKTYLAYKQKGNEALEKHKEEILSLEEDESDIETEKEITEESEAL